MPHVNLAEPSAASPVVSTESTNSVDLRVAPKWPRWLIIPTMLAVALGTAFVGNGGGFPDWIRIPVGDYIAIAFTAVDDAAPWLINPPAAVLDGAYESVYLLLSGLSAAIVATGLVLLVAYFRGWKLGALAVVLIAWVVLTGLWEDTLETIPLLAVAVAVAAALGLILGIVGSVGPRSAAVVRAVLDAMQAFPAFAYLVPVVFLFGFGSTAAIVVTVIFALPPLTRMTMLGIRNASPEVVEAAVSAGASREQLLFGVRLPLASSSIRSGVNQLVMYAVAMSTMAAMIGGPGLGAPVWAGLTRLQFGEALQGGIALVLVAILIDRVTSSSNAHRSPTRGARSRLGWDARIRLLVRGPYTVGHLYLLVFLAVVVASQTLRGSWQNFADPPWGVAIRLREPVDAFVVWITVNWGPTLDAMSDVVQRYGLGSLAAFFTGIPWLIVILCVGVCGGVLLGVRRGLVLSVLVFLIGCLGMWTQTSETLAVVTAAITLVVIIGFPVGIVMAASDKVAGALRPILDVMQTLPIYLLVIPAVMLLGIGEVAAVFATIIVALPPMIRYTNTALRGADAETVEAAVMFGARPGQVLRQVRIPLGLQTILVGLNQALMAALAMAVVSAMIGAPGLGRSILTAVEGANLALGFNAGIAMCFLAVIIDRLITGTANAVSAVQHSGDARGKKE